MNETPNLYFSGEDFTTFLMFAKSMSNSKCSKTALLHVENGKLVCKSTDSNRSNYIEYIVDLYNDDNIIDEPIAISINDLTALIKCANSNRFAIRKNMNQYEFNIIGGGWLPFKVVEVNLSSYNFAGEVSEIGSVSSVKFRNAISSVLSYTQDYSYARDKYIQFSKDQMTVTSRRSGVVSAGEFADVTLHRDDAAMLKTLLKSEFNLAKEPQTLTNPPKPEISIKEPASKTEIKETLAANIASIDSQEKLKDEKPKDEIISSNEILYLQGLKERIGVLFEGLNSADESNSAFRLDMTIRFLEFALASIENRLSNLSK